MGVKGLWQIVEPCARPVHNPESLSGQRMAVDASIWIYQFLRALPPSESHEAYSPMVLSGLFNRLCKLLYFGIKPVIVFDGPAPALKLQTTKERALRRNQAEERYRRMARKIIAAQLHLEELKIRQKTTTSKDVKAVKPPPKKQDDFDSLGSFWEEEEDERAIAVNQGEPTELGEESFLDPEYIASVDVFSPDFSKLPLDLQQEILVAKREQVLREHASSLRNPISQQQISMEALDFSRVQVDALVKRRKITEKLHQVNEGGVFDFEGDYLKSARLMERLEDMKRIAADSNRRYVLIKNQKTGGWTLDGSGSKDKIGLERERQELLAAEEMKEKATLEKMKHEDELLFGSSEMLADVEQKKTIDFIKEHIQPAPVIGENDTKIKSLISIVEIGDIQVELESDVCSSKDAEPVSQVIESQVADEIEKIPAATVDREEIVPEPRKVTEFAESSSAVPIAPEPVETMADEDESNIVDLEQIQDEMEQIYQDIGPNDIDSTEEKIQRLHQEIELLQKDQQATANPSHSTSVDTELLEDFRHLLTIMGIPWIVSPGEAEAQCAQLIKMGAVDGIITDDSDALVFGGDRLYRHFFNNSKKISLYLQKDLIKELGIDQSKMIVLAVLLGSDYCAGVAGIGPVKAKKLLQAIPKSRNTAADILQVIEGGLKTGEWPSEILDEHGKFLKALSIQCAISENQSLTDPQYIEAYTNPLVNSTNMNFTWKMLSDLTALNGFLIEKLHWTHDKIKRLVEPLSLKTLGCLIPGGCPSHLTMLKFIPRGPKVYFPNFVFTMVRSGKERKSNEVVFRVPTILNKFDIQQYLEGLYNIKIKEIKTFNFLPKVSFNGRKYKPAKKNAIVTLAEGEFKYPPLQPASMYKFPLPNLNVYPKIHK